VQQLSDPDKVEAFIIYQQYYVVPRDGDDRLRIVGGGISYVT
jgi:hypothetical protein